MTKKRGLAKGRGLDALLGLQREQQAIQQADRTHGQLINLPVQSLQRGKYQPRQYLGEAELAELAESIKKHGVMQPLVVRLIGEENGQKRYEIIAGERRWRASQLAGLTTVPAIVREIDDHIAIALALIENIQREDLNPIEQALALQRFQDEFNLNHQDIADMVGKARATISNLLRLLSLSEDVKQQLIQRQIDMGHARALLSLPHQQQSQVAHEIVQKQLSVRQTEQLVRQLQQVQPAKTTQTNRLADVDIQQLCQRLSDHLAAEVKIDHLKQGKGKIVIKYHSLDELEGILVQMGSTQSEA